MNEFGSQLDQWLLHPVIQRWALSLVHFLWQGVAVGAIYWLLLPLVNRQSSTVRYAWSLVCLAAIGMLPLVTFAVVSPLDPVPWSQKLEENVSTIETAEIGSQSFDPLAPPFVGQWPAGQSDRFVAKVPVQRESMATAWARSSAWQDLLARFQSWFAIAWLAGVALLGARLALGGAMLMRLRRTTDALPPEWRLRAEKVRRRIGTTRRVTIAASTRIGEALATGLLRPMVLLPACWLTELSPAMLEAVLAHELAHIRRGDLWVNLAQRLVETVLFYHPVVWWISAAARREREKCCDTMAVFATGDRIGYVKTLEHLAARRFSGATAACPLAAGMGENKMHLLDRVRYLLGVPSARQSIRPSLMSLLLVLLLIAAWQLTTTPQAIVAGEPAAVIETEVEFVDDDEQGHAEHREVDDIDNGNPQNFDRSPTERRREREYDFEVPTERHLGQAQGDARHVDPRGGDFIDLPPGPGWNLTEAHLQHQLAEMRQLVERQNRLIRELTRKLEATAANAHRPANIYEPSHPPRPGSPPSPDMPNLPPVDVPRGDAHFQPDQPANESRRFFEQRDLADGKPARFEVTEREVVDGDQRRITRQEQHWPRRNNPSAQRPIELGQTQQRQFRQGQFRADNRHAANLAAMVDHTRRAIHEDRQRLERQQRQAELQAQSLQEQLTEIRSRIGQEESRRAEKTEAGKVELEQQLTAQQREYELEAARLEIGYARQELEHKRGTRRAEHELVGWEEQLDDLAGEKKRDALRHIADLQIIVETADEELALAAREKEIEIEVLHAKADRENHQLSRRWRAKNLAEGHMNSAQLQEQHEMVMSQLSDAKRASLAVHARIEGEIDKRQATLEELQQELRSVQPGKN